MFANNTTGRLIRKLNFNALFPLNFLRSNNETVVPERDNPGKKDIP